MSEEMNGKVLTDSEAQELMDAMIDGKFDVGEEMTREQAIDNLRRLENLLSADCYINTSEIIATCEKAIAALSAEQDYKDFAEYVAMLIFEYDIEMDMETFSELACRKLAKLGIVRANGDKWERVK